MEATRVDDIVVGGGILGLATAWHLRRLGRSVRVLERAGATVLCSDPYSDSPVPLVDREELAEKSDAVVVGAPHSCYRGLEIEKPVIDIWGAL